MGYILEITFDSESARDREYDRLNMLMLVRRNTPSRISVASRMHGGFRAYRDWTKGPENNLVLLTRGGKPAKIRTPTK